MTDDEKRILQLETELAKALRKIARLTHQLDMARQRGARLKKRALEEGRKC